MIVPVLVWPALAAALASPKSALDDVQGLPRAEPAALGQQLAQRAPWHVLHRQEENVPLSALVIDGDDIRAG